MAESGTDSILAERFGINAPKAVAEIVDGEAIIVNLATGSYYSLLDTGAEIWREIENRSTVGEMVRTLCSRYRGSPEVIRDATIRLIRQLTEEGLVARSEEVNLPGPDPAASANPSQGLDFRPPVLEKYDDMADLILLDPIHETGPTGWPHRNDERADV